MVDLLSIVIGLVVGVSGTALVAWAVWKGSVQNQRSSSTLDQAQQAQQAQQFWQLANSALAQNSQQFLQLARSEMEGQLGREREALSGTVKPLQDSLAQVQSLVRSVEESRNKAYGDLTSQLKGLRDATNTVQRETTTLSTSLRNPQARGNWGEVALKRVVEIAGMTEHCDFDTQVSLAGMDDRVRPDMVVRLPFGRLIPVDAKVPLSSYLDAMAESKEGKREELFRRHAEQIKARLRELAGKGYSEKLQALGQTTEFTVMFVPGDDFLAAALQADPGLFELAAKEKIMLAGPTMLLPLLRVVEAGWRQEKFLKSVEQVRDEARTLYDRLADLTGHLGDLGKRLDGAVSAYNRLQGSYERRVMPQVRKFEEMGVQGSKSLPELERIGNEVRGLAERGNRLTEGGDRTG